MNERAGTVVDQPAVPPEIAVGWLHSATTTHVFQLDAAGVVQAANAAAVRALGRPGATLIGIPLANMLCENSVVPLPDAEAESVLLTFDGIDARYTLSCRMFAANDNLWLVGEPAAVDADLESELRRANNELAVLAREFAQQAVALQTAVDERARAEWTLERVGEVLPICMSCGDLQTADGAHWGTAAQFLMDNGVPLSHGLCPACAENARRAAGLGPR